MARHHGPPPQGNSAQTSRASIAANQFVGEEQIPPPWPPGPLSGGASASKEPTLAGIHRGPGAIERHGGVPVYQDPVDNHGFGYRYNSAAGAAAPPPAQFARGEFAPGGEARV